MRDKRQNFQGCFRNTFSSMMHYTSNNTEFRTMPAMHEIHKVQKMRKFKFWWIVDS